MGKLLSWILLGALAYLAWRVVVILQRKQARSRADEGTTGARPSANPEAMVRCDRCGVYLPASEAIVDGDRRYCCAAHQDGR